MLSQAATELEAGGCNAAPIRAKIGQRLKLIALLVDCPGCSFVLLEAGGGVEDGPYARLGLPVYRLEAIDKLGAILQNCKHDDDRDRFRTHYARGG